MDSRLLWVCVGGAAGTAARYWLTEWALQVFGTAFPYGTLLVNALGSLLVGIVLQVGLSTDLLTPTVRIALAAGVMGGFTTYSAFCFESLRYFEQGAWGLGFVYVLSMVLGCLAACALGVAVVKWFGV